MSQLKKTDRYVALWALAAILGSIYFGKSAVVGTAVGGVLAMANWAGFRWAGVRMAATGNKARFGVFLGIKMVAILAAVLIVLSTEFIEPLPFLVGLSALVLGVLTKSAVVALAEGGEAIREEQ